MLTGKIDIDPTRRYTVSETAKILGICRATLYKYTKSHDIRPMSHTATRKMYYTGAEIQRFFNCTI